MNTAGSYSSLICLFESACKSTKYIYDLFGAIDQSFYKPSAKNKGLNRKKNFREKKFSKIVSIQYILIGFSLLNCVMY